MRINLKSTPAILGFCERTDDLTAGNRSNYLNCKDNLQKQPTVEDAIGQMLVASCELCSGGESETNYLRQSTFARARRAGPPAWTSLIERVIDLSRVLRKTPHTRVSEIAE